MLELNPYRKNNIKLEDYDHTLDVRNRVLMAKFTAKDTEVLEEILFSSLNFSLKSLFDNLDYSFDEVMDSVDTLQKTGLFQIKDDKVVVDKELRRYFEFQIEKFEDGFIPDLSYLQDALKRVPIHILPVWYQLPRSSDNIFNSILEKYFETPHTFERYLMETSLDTETQNAIVTMLYQSPQLELSAEDIKKRFNLSDDSFEKLMLQLEFNFIAFVCFKKDDQNDCYKQVVCPIKEIRDYLLAEKAKVIAPIKEQNTVFAFREHEFAFAEDLSLTLHELKSNPIVLDQHDDPLVLVKNAAKVLLKRLSSIAFGQPEMTDELVTKYIETLLEKAMMVDFAQCVSGRLTPTDYGLEWAKKPAQSKAMHLLKHPLNQHKFDQELSALASERNLREIEKSLSTVLNKGWVNFREFMSKFSAPIGDHKLKLKKVGRSWTYARPNYSPTEEKLIEECILHYFFETGLVTVGVQNQEPCFKVTSLSQSLYS